MREIKQIYLRLLYSQWQVDGVPSSEQSQQTPLCPPLTLLQNGLHYELSFIESMWITSSEFHRQPISLVCLPTKFCVIPDIRYIPFAIQHLLLADICIFFTSYPLLGSIFEPELCNHKHMASRSGLSCFQILLYRSWLLWPPSGTCVVLLCI